MIYKSLYERLSNQHEAINPIIENIDNNRLKLHPFPGKWSIHDNIAHLAKYQTVFIDRMNTILDFHEPVFERYNAENDPDFDTWRNREINYLLETLSIDRRQIFNIISSLTSQELDRVGQHIKFGRLTILKWTEFFLLHEAHHIFTIFQLAYNTELITIKF